MTDTTLPSFVALPERFAAVAAPFFLKLSIATAISPPASVRAFLQSIIPSPVFSRNSATIPAVIVIFSSFVYLLV
jgi:hypothetical protein